MKLRVLFDHQTFSLQKFGGISRYFYEVIKGTNKYDSVQITTSLYLSNNFYLSQDSNIKYLRIPSIFDIKGIKRIEKIINKQASIKQLKANQFDVFHPTYYDPYFLDYLNGKPYVITVHDLTHERLKLQTVNKNFLIQKRTSIEHANKIIAISESTKRDLIEIYNIDEKKIDVIYHGNSLQIPKNLSLPKSYPDNYLLFVGARNAYKNFGAFLNAMASILLSNNDLNIVCAGGGKFTSDENQLINRLGLPSKVRQYSINDQDLSRLYNNAKAFIFPSYYEGFGIPLLEAFACDCPVICSNTSSFPEVALDAAIYFDPYNIDSIKNAVFSVLNNDRLRNELILKGQKRLNDFSWENAAKKTLEVYDSLIS